LSGDLVEKSSKVYLKKYSTNAMIKKKVKINFEK
jgi:hypothetical protein